MEMTLMQTAILCTFDILQYYLWVNKIINKKFDFKKSDLLYMLPAMVLVTIVSYYAPTPLTYAMNSLVFMGLCYSIYKIKGFKLIYVHLISVMCILTLQFVILIVMKLLYNQYLYTFEIFIVAQGISVLGAFLSAKFLPVELFLNYVDAHNKTFKVILVNIILLLTYCVVAWTLQRGVFIKNISMISIITAVVILVNTILLKTSLNNEVVEAQNRLYEQYMPIVNSLIDEVRAKQHDFDNHITALKMMIGQERDVNKALKQLDDYIDELYGNYKERELIRIENKVVAGFLYSKIKQAEELCIRLDLNIESTVIMTTLKDYQLMEILSILIDNAFETSVSDNHVKVSFKKEKNKSVIEVFNRHPYISTDYFQKMFTNGYSSKGENNRGIGLYKLQQILNKEPGELVVSNCEMEGNYVAFKVTLP